MPAEERGVRFALRFRPVEFGFAERFRVLRVGNLFRIPAEGGEFAATAFADGAGKLRIAVIAEVEERRSGAPLVALEEHGNEWRAQHHGCRDPQTAGAHQMKAALALGAIADLIVV